MHIIFGQFLRDLWPLISLKICLCSISCEILDSRGQVDTFRLDFEKAFDTPHHELLKSKLFSYGTGGKTLKWIDAFLCFRQQRVVVNGVKSDWAPVFSPRAPYLVHCCSFCT